MTGILGSFQLVVFCETAHKSLAEFESDPKFRA